MDLARDIQSIWSIRAYKYAYVCVLVRALGTRDVKMSLWLSHDIVVVVAMLSFHKRKIKVAPESRIKRTSHRHRKRLQTRVSTKKHINYGIRLSIDDDNNTCTLPLYIL